jgi:hypothetical protein
VTVAAVAKSPVDALFAEMVHRPVCPAIKDTVACETPLLNVDEPTVQRLVVDDVKFTWAFDDVVADIVNV